MMKVVKEVVGDGPPDDGGDNREDEGLAADEATKKVISDEGIKNAVGNKVFKEVVGDGSYSSLRS